MPVLIDLITGENIVQSFTANQVTCSYNVLFVDTTTITPSFYDRGRVEYFIKYPDLTRRKIGETAKGGQFYYDFCNSGIFTIVQRLTIREIPNCGGLSPIIYQSEIEQNVTVLENVPNLDLPGIEECLIKNSQAQINLVFQLNNNNCGSLPNNLKIEVLESPIDSSISNVDITPTSSPYVWQPTINKAGVYRVKITLQNCCHSISKIFEFFVCEPLQVKKDCCDCSIFYINNYSNRTISYTIKQLYPEDNEFEQISSTLESNKQSKIEVEEDGIYEIRYDEDGEKIYIWHVFCKIDACLNNILKNILCTDCSECPSEVEVKEREKLNKIVLLTQLYFKWIDEEMKGKLYNISFDNPFLDYENRLKDLFKVSDVYEKILEICSNCGSYNSKDCKCGCK